MIQYDSATSPTKAEVAAAIAANPSLGAWQGYVPNWGGPGDGGWSAEAVAAVLEAGLGFLPLLVPANGSPSSVPQDDAGWDVAIQEARNQLAAAEALIAADDAAEGDQPQTVELTIVGIDVEAGWSNGNPDGWKAAVGQFVLAAHRGGAKAVTYGSPSFVASLASLPAEEIPDVIYGGVWPNGVNPPTTGVPASPASIPGISNDVWNGPGQRIWQFQGGHPSGVGVQIDASISTPEVPYVRLPAATPIQPVPVPTPDPGPTPASSAEAALTEAMTALDSAEAAIGSAKTAVTNAVNALTAS